MRWKRPPELRLRLFIVMAIGLGGMIAAGFAVTDLFVRTACHTPLLVRFTPFPLSRSCPFPVERADDRGRAAATLHVYSAEDVAARRRALNVQLWNSVETPTELLPTAIYRNVQDERVAGLPNLDHADELDTSFPYGFLARGFHLVPVRGNGRLVIYCEGHEGSFTNDGREKVSALLAAGFAVLAFDMPMRGVNEWPHLIRIPGLGEVPFEGESHWNLALLESDGFVPLRMFFEPILRALNYVEHTSPYELVAMLGLSGGGWMTTVYSALDPRVDRSYPVAGSMPFFLWEEHPISHRHEDEGDYEQRLPGLFANVSHLDLYAMGASGPGRRQVQILNRYDPCCFFGTRSRAYASLVADAVRDIGAGGSYRLAIDQTHEQHAISTHALGLILEDASSPLCDGSLCEGEEVAQLASGARDRWAVVE
ncbi:MAG: hypothetical protein AB7I59_06965 [Geminicoccaceae bacterium]